MFKFDIDSQIAKIYRLKLLNMSYLQGLTEYASQEKVVLYAVISKSTVLRLVFRNKIP